MINRKWSDAERGLLVRIMVLMVIAVFLAVGVNIWYTGVIAHRSENKWCQIMTYIDERNQALPEADPDTMEFRRLWHELRQEYRCR